MLLSGELCVAVQCGTAKLWFGITEIIHIVHLDECLKM